MLYEIVKSNNKNFKIIDKFMEKSASELDIKEKTIENLFAENRKLLFPNEDILVIAQSISGQGMADILALDGQGNLIIVEIKRDWSDRNAVAQLLSYAANFQNVTYEKLNSIAQKYANFEDEDLYIKFSKFIDLEDFQKDKLGKGQRIFVVAPRSDTELKKIIDWLKNYGVPIQFIPFSLLAKEKGQLKFIEIEGVEISSVHDSFEEGWAGHWIFNTNETFGKGAYHGMFKNEVIAIYGYDNGPKNLEGSSAGDKVFAYTNGQGIKALGTILDPKVEKGSGIFLDEKGNQKPDEYHVKVKWDVILEQAFTNREATNLGYYLPVRTTFGKLHKGNLAKEIEKRIRERKKQENQKK